MIQKVFNQQGPKTTSNSPNERKGYVGANLNNAPSSTQNFITRTPNNQDKPGSYNTAPQFYPTRRKQRTNSHPNHLTQQNAHLIARANALQQELDKTNAQLNAANEKLKYFQHEQENKLQRVMECQRQCFQQYFY